MASSATLTTAHLPQLHIILDKWNQTRTPSTGFSDIPTENVSKEVIVAFRMRPPLPNEKFQSQDSPAAESIEFCAGITARNRGDIRRAGKPACCSTRLLLKIKLPKGRVECRLRVHPSSKKFDGTCFTPCNAKRMTIPDPRDERDDSLLTPSPLTLLDAFPADEEEETDYSGPHSVDALPQPCANICDPDNKLAKLVLDAKPPAAEGTSGVTPASAPRPSSARKHVRAPCANSGKSATPLRKLNFAALPTQHGLLFQIPATNGRPWDVSPLAPSPLALPALPVDVDEKEPEDHRDRAHAAVRVEEQGEFGSPLPDYDGEVGRALSAREPAPVLALDDHENQNPSHVPAPAPAASTSKQMRDGDEEGEISHLRSWDEVKDAEIPPPPRGGYGQSWCSSGGNEKGEGDGGDGDARAINRTRGYDDDTLCICGIQATEDGGRRSASGSAYEVLCDWDCDGGGAVSSVCDCDERSAACWPLQERCDKKMASEDGFYTLSEYTLREATARRAARFTAAKAEAAAKTQAQAEANEDGNSASSAVQSTCLHREHVQPIERDDTLYRLVRLVTISTQSTRPALTEVPVLAVDLLCQSVAPNADVSAEIETTICNELVKFVSDLQPINKAHLIALLEARVVLVGLRGG
ncbi:hypothetical protein B0H13DRAFT_2307948 [Mycena leptocephala]|nr:hypothetical protein B0H13DRAFT_2307948 [Mycena leptocephala]